MSLSEYIQSAFGSSFTILPDAADELAVKPYVWKTVRIALSEAIRKMQQQFSRSYLREAKKLAGSFSNSGLNRSLRAQIFDNKQTENDTLFSSHAEHVSASQPNRHFLRP